MNEEIIKFLADKDKVSLKDIYGAFPDKKPYLVRGYLNFLVKHNKILRVERGLYTHI